MFSSEVRALLAQVIASWQVWAVTIVLVIYISLVKYVANIYSRRIRPPSIPKVKKAKPEKTKEPAVQDGSGSDADMEGVELEE